MGFFAGPAEITPQNKAEDSPGARTTAPAGDSAGSGRADLSALRRKVLASVVTIRSAAGQGTGFIIEQRLVATAYHVVPKGKTATVVFEDGERAEVVEHVACDPIRDVAVLRIDTTRKLKSLELASTLPAAGEPVASFQPGGGELKARSKSLAMANPPATLTVARSFLLHSMWSPAGAGALLWTRKEGL